MKFDIDRWDEIITTITRNKSRSLLTAFGVFWGVFMLVGMLGFGNSFQETMSKNFEGFATNSAFMFSSTTSLPYKGFQRGRHWSIELSDIERLKNSIPELDVVTPLLSRSSIRATYQEFETTCVLRGIYPDMGRVEGLDIRYGRALNQLDMLHERKVCVIGKEIYQQLFPHSDDPCGRSIRIGGTYYQIVGVDFSSRNINIDGRSEETIQIPFPVMQKTFNYGKHIDLVALTAHPKYKISQLESRIKEILFRVHNIAPNDKQALWYFSAEVLFTMQDNLMRGIKILIWLVGLGTLIAGAIGVSNIMLVTVKERTTEFGIRRAIGAKPSDIITQIMLESSILTLFAGLLGIIFASIILQGLELASTTDGITETHYQVSFGIIVGAMLCISLLGILAGLAPSLRALSIKPIDAIRDE